LRQDGYTVAIVQNPTISLADDVAATKRIIASWAEHLRQHERITAEDQEAERSAQAFHVGARPPKITHLIAKQLPD